MHLARIFINRPVMTGLAAVAVLLFGALAYRNLPVSDLPNVDFPTISVSASLPGATPETMASSVAMPLERQFSSIAGLSSLTSTSFQGITQINLQFDLNRSLDAAAQDVQASIAKASRELPPNMPSPPTYEKVNPADSPILYLALSSGTVRLSELDRYAETLIAERISMVKGVAQVTVYGAQKYAVHVKLDPKALASRQLGMDDVTNAIAAANVNQPTGTLDGGHRAFAVQANGQLYRAGDYSSVVVAYRNGAPVRLQDLGRVVDGVETERTASWYYDAQGGLRRAIVLTVQRQPGANTVEVVDSINALLPTFRLSMPPPVELKVLYDRSKSIRASVSDVKLALILAVFLVVLVIFLFLRNLRATVIPSLAIPMSLVGTFGVMYLLGFSLDNLSLMALTLSVGFVVDDAIVVLENIVRHIEAGEQPSTAAALGVEEIAFTIISMTLSLIAVFLPVLFMGGILGRLLREFSVTISVAILVSGVVSLSLTPMLCSRFLRASRVQDHAGAYRIAERLFDGMLRLYDRSLRFTLEHRKGAMGLFLSMLGATVFLFYAVPKGFLPDEDTGQLFVFTEGPQGTSFSDMAKHQTALSEVVAKQPWVDSFMSTAAGGNAGRIFIHLTPRETRASAIELVPQLLEALGQVPGIAAYPQVLPPIRLGATLTKSQYQITLRGSDTRELYEVASRLESELRANPKIQALVEDVVSDLQIRNPQVNVEIHRDKASALGVTAGQLEDALNTAYSQRQVSTIYAADDTYRVIAETDDRYQLDPSLLSLLYVRSSSGHLVPLDVLARLRPGVGPFAVNHLGQLPAVTISFNVRAGASLSTAIDAIRQEAERMLPPTISTTLQGTAQVFDSSLSGLWVLIGMAVLVIYLVLGALYEDLLHPVTILSGLPSAGLGALVTLVLFRVSLNLYAFVGMILLIGIIKKNAIMMIDVALTRQRKTTASPEEAIHGGALLRFRPIMMTTLAALVSTLPIAVGLGAGSESRRPLGLAVVGGLFCSQFLTLYITPVFYVYAEALRNWLKSFRSREESTRGLKGG